MVEDYGRWLLVEIFLALRGVLGVRFRVLRFRASSSNCMQGFFGGTRCVFTSAPAWIEILVYGACLSCNGLWLNRNAFNPNPRPHVVPGNAQAEDLI